MENQTETNSVEVVQPVTEFEPIVAPKELQHSMNLDHLGVVLSNLTIFGMIFAISVLLGKIVFFVFMGLAFITLFMVCIMLIVVTCGIVLLSQSFNDFFHHVAHMGDDMDKVMQVFDMFYSILPYYSFAFVAISLCSILCLKFNKNFKHTGRFITSCIALGLFGIVSLLFIVGGVLWIN